MIVALSHPDRRATASREAIDDLKVAIIRNETGTDFVTSDDPAALTNRVHLQTLKSDSFGLVSCGMQLYLPLTPKLGLMAYDGEAYGAPSKRGNWIPITRTADALALNELQYLNCDENIYFGCWNDRCRIAIECREAVPRRLETVTRFWVGILIEENDNGDLYRRATEEETSTTATKIVSMAPVFPIPGHWFGGLRFKRKVLGYFPATGNGLFRHAYAFAKRFSVRFTKIRVQPGLDLFPGPDGPETVLHKRSASDWARKADCGKQR